MAYCSINEAYGNDSVPGLDNIRDNMQDETYTSVNYDDSNLYKCDGSQYSVKSVKSIKRAPNMSRTNERLPQHSGPINRYSNKENNLVLTYDNNNTIQYDNSKNYHQHSEVPISNYSKKIKSRKTYSTPVHDIILKSQSIKNDDDSDINDTIDSILDRQQQNRPIRQEISSSNASIDSADIRIRNRVIKKKRVDNEYLLLKNRELEEQIRVLQKQLKKIDKGVFTTTDLLVVCVLGILMIIVLQVVYKVALILSKGN